jgi:hypothetical protein
MEPSLIFTQRQSYIRLAARVPNPPHSYCVARDREGRAARRGELATAKAVVCSLASPSFYTPNKVLLRQAHDVVGRHGIDEFIKFLLFIL